MRLLADPPTAWRRWSGASRRGSQVCPRRHEPRYGARCSTSPRRWCSTQWGFGRPIARRRPGPASRWRCNGRSHTATPRPCALPLPRSSRSAVACSRATTLRLRASTSTLACCSLSATQLQRSEHSTRRSTIFQGCTAIYCDISRLPAVWSERWSCAPTSLRRAATAPRRGAGRPRS